MNFHTVLRNVQLLVAFGMAIIKNSKVEKYRISF